MENPTLDLVPVLLFIEWVVVSFAIALLFGWVFGLLFRIGLKVQRAIERKLSGVLRKSNDSKSNTR